MGDLVASELSDVVVLRILRVWGLSGFVLKTFTFENSFGFVLISSDEKKLCLHFRCVHFRISSFVSTVVFLDVKCHSAAIDMSI